MANPQIEDGHTRIANEILEHLMTIHLSPNQWRVLLCIIRKTYGFHKKVDYIANFQIVGATGLCKAVVSRALHELEDMQFITRKGKYIGFQKNWEKWIELAVLSTLKSKLAVSSTELAESSTKVDGCAVTQKIKETIQKKLFKRKYGEFNNVLLTDEEYQKLEDKFAAKVPDMIEALSEGIESKGYKYKSHYATLLSWRRREEREKGGSGGTHRGSPREIPKTYKTPEQHLENYRTRNE